MNSVFGYINLFGLQSAHYISLHKLAQWGKKGSRNILTSSFGASSLVSKLAQRIPSNAAWLSIPLYILYDL